MAAGRLRRVREKLAAIEKEIADLDTGARTFGFLPRVEEIGGVTEDDPRPALSLATNDAPPLFKDAALELLSKAYPGSMKAAEVQEGVQTAHKRKYHWKTAGMTLYRLKKEGAVRRKGQNWFWVPPDQRVPELPSGSTGDPDDEDLIG